MIRVAVIISGLDVGGAERTLLRLLERLDRQRFEPHVISLTGEGVLGPLIAALGIPVTALGMQPGWAGAGDLARLVRLVRALRPQVVHTWMYHADLLGGVAARLAGVRAVAWSIHHANLDPALNKRSTLMVMRACAALSRWVPRRIVSCSEKSRAVHTAAGYDGSRMLVIPNGTDLQAFAPDAGARASILEELGLPAGVRLAGMIGRADPLKNHLGLVTAAQRMCRAEPNLHLLLAGAGVDATNGPLNTAIAAAGLQHAFHLLGPREDVPRLMAGLDVLLMPSDGEAFPNVLGEAMACGVPCVVTDVGDAAFIVGDTGRVVPAGAMEALADAALDLLRMPGARRSEAGGRARARVRENFDVGHMVRRYEQLYQELGSS